jgi:hypothetical protein
MPVTRDVALAQLHQSLDQRRRPEDVASLCGVVLANQLDKRERLVLGRAARHSDSGPLSWSLMSSDWERPVGCAAQVATVAALFGEGDTPDPDDLDAVRAWAVRLGERVGWAAGDAKLPDRQAAAALGWSGSRRNYVRRWKALGHLTDKAGRLERSAQRRHLAVLGRSGMASQVGLDEFRRDPDAACFMAYFTARANVRRAFSLDGKANPMDEVAGMLFDRLGPESNWSMVASVLPTSTVLDRLSERQSGELVGRWHRAMREAADVLGELDRSNPVDRHGMVVRRGNDSATWNLAAQSYNKARDGWMNALHSAGISVALESYCPPKAMRLMAADLIAWYRLSGRDPVAPDVKVAALLPPAWDVFSGAATCSRADVVAACKRVGLDPVKSGWAGRRARRGRAVFEPTPELVHGIAVRDPLMADMLRRGGAWSGKRIKPELAEVLDQIAVDGMRGGLA